MEPPSRPAADAARPIALVGYRGAGKSALGQALARHLQRPFLDLDEVLEERQGRTIPELFQECGEARFRDLEGEVLGQALVVPGRVLATGGGVVEREAHRRLLQERARVIYLCLPVEELCRRLRAGPVRPALTDRPLDQEVAEVLGRRDPWYRAVAERVLEVPAGEREGRTLARLIQVIEAGPGESRV